MSLTSKIRVRGLKIEMTGAQTTATPGVRKGIIDALTSDPRFEPTKYSTHERIRDDFDYDGACQLATGEPTQTSFYLWRTKVAKYEADFSQSKRSAILFEFPETTARKHWQRIFELGDRLAHAYTPDIGFSHVRNYSYEAFPTGELGFVESNLMDSGTSIPPSRYFRKGAGGLGTRTYIGPFVIAQIGEDRIRSLPSPATVRDTEWGGLCVDLVPEPWKLPLDKSEGWEELLESWRACMDHLAPAKWFSEMKLNERDGGVNFIPPTHPGWDPGGVVRND